MTTKRGNAAEVLAQMRKEEEEAKAVRKAANEKKLKEIFEKSGIFTRIQLTDIDVAIKAGKFDNQVTQILKKHVAIKDDEIDRQVTQLLSKRSEKEITGEIELMILRMRDLYQERRGAILQDGWGEGHEEGDFVWCLMCGMELVNLNTEPRMICRECQTV